MNTNFDLTQNHIAIYKADSVKALFNNEQLFWYAMESNDYKRIEKLLTINTLVGFWDKVRQFTKKVTSDHAISHWQSLAELRYIQLDLQRNYNKETLTKNH